MAIDNNKSPKLNFVTYRLRNEDTLLSRCEANGTFQPFRRSVYDDDYN